MFVGIPLLIVFGPSLLMYIEDRYKELWARLHGAAAVGNASTPTHTHSMPVAMPLTTHAAHVSPSPAPPYPSASPSVSATSDLYSYWR